MGIADVTQDEIDALLDRYFSIPDLQPGDFNVNDMMARYEISRSRARDRVNQMLADGVIEIVGRVDNKKYYRVKQDGRDSGD